jgi:hypothetical protein
MRAWLFSALLNHDHAALRPNHGIEQIARGQLKDAGGPLQVTRLGLSSC